MMSPNEGQRPSRLALDRYATGELTDAERSAVEARLDDRARRHLAAVEASRSGVPAFDPAALRRRADGARPANDAVGFRWLGFVGIAAMAAALLVAVGLRGTTPDPTVRYRTGEQLEVYQLAGESLAPYAAGTPVGEDDVLGFQVTGPGHRGVVVLSVDGTGAVSVFYPASGDAPEPIDAETPLPLPGTVILDGAPGPEVFVAVFDRSVPEARAAVARVYADGGAAAVEAWADAEAGVSAVEVTRR
ncbi:MAG: hypothetical protein ABMB14_03680 [Myxococcota bacterium]